MDDCGAALLLDGEGPLWQQIRRAIARPILNGAWPPGSPVPSEAELMRRFGTARMTVHRALRSLAGEGMVERRRRRGTRVAARAPERPVFEIWDVAAEVERSGRRYGFRLLSRAALGLDDPGSVHGRALLGVGAQVPAQRLVCVHLADGEPIQYEDRLLSLDAAPTAVAERFERVPPGRWLLQHVAWTEAEHAILAQGASAEAAAALGVAEGAPCLVVERRTWNSAQPVTFVRLWSLGGHSRLVGRFRQG